MLRYRAIPCLLLKGQGLVKTVKFQDPKYVGDPINAIKIFNDKEVDELTLLDITASSEGRGPSFKVIEEVASECFMPLAYGGGIRSIQDIRAIVALGVEKVVLNTAAIHSPELIAEAAAEIGTQSVVVSIDVSKKFFGGYEVMGNRGRVKTGRDPLSFAQFLAKLGAGEILLNAIHRDGTQIGYDTDLIKLVSGGVSVPVIAVGGAGNLQDLAEAVQSGAAAAAAGSLFVFHGRHRAVLISYPSFEELRGIFRE
jgi:cyclase